MLAQSIWTKNDRQFFYLLSELYAWYSYWRSMKQIASNFPGKYYEQARQSSFIFEYARWNIRWKVYSPWSQRMLYFGNWQERKYVICCTIIRKATNSVTEMEVSEEDANWLRIVIQNAASNRYHFGQRHLNLLASEIAEWGPRVRTGHISIC